MNTLWGAHAPSRAVSGAHAGHSSDVGQVAGDGARSNTRGRVCSPRLRVSASLLFYILHSALCLAATLTNPFPVAVRSATVSGPWVPCLDAQIPITSTGNVFLARSYHYARTFALPPFSIWDGIGWETIILTGPTIDPRQAWTFRWTDETQTTVTFPALHAGVEYWIASRFWYDDNNQGPWLLLGVSFTPLNFQLSTLNSPLSPLPSQLSTLNSQLSPLRPPP